MVKLETSKPKSGTNGGSAISTQTGPASSLASSHLCQSRNSSCRNPGSNWRNSTDAQTAQRASCSDMFACLLLLQPIHKPQISRRSGQIDGRAKVVCFYTSCQIVTVLQVFVIGVPFTETHIYTPRPLRLCKTCVNP